MILTGSTDEEKDRVGNFVCSNLGTKWSRDRFQVIGCELNGKLVGGSIFEHVTKHNVFVHIYIDGNHPGMKEFLYFGFYYPFKQLKVDRLTAMVDSTNKLCINLVERMGFKEETRLKGAGDYGDLIFFTMLKNECKWISHEN